MSKTLKFENKKEFLNRYEKGSKIYDNERLRDYEGKKVLRTQLEILNKVLKKHKSKKILEAGCGTGRILIPLTNKGYNIDGFDLSKGMLTELNKKDKRIKTKIGDIEKIPYKDNSYDLVYSITVLMHMTKINKAIEELLRVTKKGGYVIFDLPNKESIWTKLSIILNSKKKRSLLYSRKDIKKILKGKDFQITGIFSYARTFYKIPAIKHIINLLDNYIPLPTSFRTMYIIIIKKN